MVAYPTVLVIDDDPMAVQLVSNALQEEDYQVLSALDGPQGLRLMYENHPDLIVLDINMPTMDGWVVCQRIREVSDIPVIMVTAQDSPDEIIKGLDMGADDYITKPYEINVLLARVRATLRRATAEPNHALRNCRHGQNCGFLRTAVRLILFYLCPILRISKSGGCCTRPGC